MLWTPNGVARYSSVKTWRMFNTRSRELRTVGCVERLTLLAEQSTMQSHWVTSHAVEFYS